MKTLSVLCLFVLLSGCATRPDEQASLPGIDRPAAAPVDVGIDWGWRVVGDAAARPVQVFSMGDQTYVQMRDQRPVVLVVNGEVLPYRRSDPYMVIQGVPDRVDVVLDGYRAVAEHKIKPAALETAQINRIERVKIK